MMGKICTKCGLDKPQADYYSNPRAPGRLFHHCKDCDRARARKWIAAKRKADPEYALDVKLRHLYGIGLAGYRELLASQGGKCAVCEAHEPNGRGKRFHVDHDHNCCPGPRSCGACVRGLLCDTCNVGLGSFRDNVDHLMAAAAYLLASENILERATRCAP